LRDAFVHQEKALMRKAIIALLAAATLVAGSFNQAEARNGGAVAAGIIGGLAAGAIIGGAIAGSRPAYAYPAYAPAPGYVVYEGYYAPGPVGCPGGYWARRPRFDQWGNVVGYSRPRFFCP
jgi:hypothetical protein